LEVDSEAPPEPELPLEADDVDSLELPESFEEPPSLDASEDAAADFSELSLEPEADLDPLEERLSVL
jgi:hypothetical protein